MFITRIENHDQYKKYQNEFGPVYLDLMKTERSLTDNKDSTFTIPGLSYPAQKFVDFYVDKKYGDGKSINLRERLVCPITGLNNRLRATIHISEIELELKPYHTIYISEYLTPIYQFLKKKYPNLSGSEYLGDNYKGGYINKQGVRHEDLTHLSYPDAYFDSVITLETLEHIPDFKKTFLEINRVLKPKGRLLWSVPFVSSSYSNIIRAKLNENNEVVHLLPAEYHGDPVRAEGILCFTHFGWQMLDQIRDAGFSKAYAIIYWSDTYGYLGGEQILFVAIK